MLRRNPLCTVLMHKIFDIVADSVSILTIFKIFDFYLGVNCMCELRNATTADLATCLFSAQNESSSVAIPC